MRRATPSRSCPRSATASARSWCASAWKTRASAPAWPAGSSPTWRRRRCLRWCCCGRAMAPCAVDRPRSREVVHVLGFPGFFSQMFLYMAMSVAPVTVVSPINRLSILFRLYFSRLAQSAARGVRRQVILATVVSLAGAVALSLSTERCSRWCRCRRHGRAAELAVALVEWGFDIRDPPGSEGATRMSNPNSTSNIYLLVVLFNSNIRNVAC